MDNFNMKQWLLENRMGPFRKVPLNEMNPSALGRGQEEADEEMLAKDSRSGGDWVDNVSMDVMAEDSYKAKKVDIKEWEVTISGKQYMIDAEVDTNYHIESDSYYDSRRIDGGVVIDEVEAKITSLQVGDGEEYRSITDPAYIKQIENKINKDPELNRGLEDQVVFWMQDPGEEDAGAEDDYESDDDVYEADNQGMNPAESSKRKVNFIRLLSSTRRYDRDMLIDLIDDLLQSLPNEAVAKIISKVEKEIADYDEREYPDYSDSTNETVGYAMKTKESDPDKKF